MALWQFTNFNKYGNPRTRIIHRPDGEGFSHGPGFGPTMVSRFQYEYKHEVLPPGLVSIGGELFLVPTWQKVDKNITLKDIHYHGIYTLTGNNYTFENINIENCKAENATIKGLFFYEVSFINSNFKNSKFG